EQHAFESCKSRRIEVLDDFNDGRRVESFQPVIPVQQRSMQQIDARALTRRHSVEVKTLARVFQRAKRDIHSHNAIQRLHLEELSQQSPFPATEVHDGLEAKS